MIPSARATSLRSTALATSLALAIGLSALPVEAWAKPKVPLPKPRPIARSVVPKTTANTVANTTANPPANTSAPVATAAAAPAQPPAVTAGWVVQDMRTPESAYLE